MDKQKKNITGKVEFIITTRTFIKVVLLILVIIISISIFKKTSHALLLIFIAFFLALALNAPVRAVGKILPGKLKNNRSLATTISFLIVVILLGFFLAYIVPPLVRQTENFINASPRLIREFNNQSGTIGKIIRKYHLGSQVNSLSRQVSARIHNFSGVAFNAITSIGSSAFALLTILVLTFMMLVEGTRWLELIKKVIPPRRYQLANRLGSDMYQVIRGYVNGQVLLAALAAILITPGVFFLHISYPIALMVVIFVCGLIPMVGHTIGAIIVTSVGLFHSFSAGIIILIYYILYQQFENYIIQPKIQANSTKMSPLLVFGSLVIGLSFGGLLGGLVAIPVAGCLRIAILELLRSKGLINDREFKQSTNPEN